VRVCFNRKVPSSASALIVVELEKHANIPPLAPPPCCFYICTMVYGNLDLETCQPSRSPTPKLTNAALRECVWRCEVAAHSLTTYHPCCRYSCCCNTSTADIYFRNHLAPTKEHQSILQLTTLSPSPCGPIFAKICDAIGEQRPCFVPFHVVCSPGHMSSSLL
jgi:hypothetical protein